MEYVYIMRAKYMRVCLLPTKDKEWAVNSIAMGICIQANSKIIRNMEKDSIFGSTPMELARARIINTMMDNGGEDYPMGREFFTK